MGIEDALEILKNYKNKRFGSNTYPNEYLAIDQTDGKIKMFYKKNDKHSKSCDISYRILSADFYEITL